MEWLTENWFWLLLGTGFIAMHFFGHGCHGKDKKKVETEKKHD